LGVLQILKFEKDPWYMKIRYKMTETAKRAVGSEPGRAGGGVGGGER